MNVVFLEFCAPDDRTSFWPCIRTVESLITQRAIWDHWQRFLSDPDNHLTWKYVGQSKTDPTHNANRTSLNAEGSANR